MDVVVKPSLSRHGTWDLHDRLGRSVGAIRQAVGSFVIEPASESVLAKVPLGPYGALAQAMDAIASLTNGACELSDRQI